MAAVGPRSVVGENRLRPSFVKVGIRVGTTTAKRKDYT